MCKSIHEIEIDYLTSQRHTLHTDHFSLNRFLFLLLFGVEIEKKIKNILELHNQPFFLCAEKRANSALIKTYWIIKCMGGSGGLGSFCGKKCFRVNNKTIKTLSGVNRRRIKMSYLFSSCHKWEALVPVPSTGFSGLLPSFLSQIFNFISLTFLSRSSHSPPL